MRELNVNEIEQVSDGNPLVVALVIRVATHPAVRGAVQSGLAAIAGAAGYEAGSGS